MIPDEGQVALAENLQALAQVARGLAEICEDIGSDLACIAPESACSDSGPGKPRAARVKDDLERLLNADEVAELLGVHPRTLRRNVLAGRAPKPIKGRKSRPRWRPADVRSWMEEKAR